jgi:hypothetical protein
MSAIGVLPGATAFFIRRTLNEPDPFVKMIERIRHRPHALRLLAAHAPMLRISLNMVIFCAVQNFGYYGVMIWLPYHLSTRFHYGRTKSAVWTAVTILGMAIGIHAFGHIAARAGRRPHSSATAR